jgi:uncharacterized lipoprotein YmbA
LAAWLLGCLAAWLLGCLAAWLLGCLAAWLLGCASSQSLNFFTLSRKARFPFRQTRGELIVVSIEKGFG